MKFQIKEKCIFLNRPLASKEELFAFIAKQAVQLGISRDEAALIAAFDEREQIGSTLITEGIALPHARSPHISKLSVFVISSERLIPYNEEGEARLFFPLMAPLAANNEFVDSLSKIAQIIMDEEIHNFISASDVKSLIAKIEKIFTS